MQHRKQLSESNNNTASGAVGDWVVAQLVGRCYFHIWQRQGWDGLGVVRHQFVHNQLKMRFQCRFMMKIQTA